MNIQTDSSQVLLSKLLDATALRHRVLANNLANVDTPNFVRKDVPFEDELKAAVEQNGAAEFSPKVKEDLSQPMRSDGNNVSMDHEVAAMSENAVMNQMALQLLQTKLAMQRIAITGHS